MSGRDGGCSSAEAGCGGLVLEPVEPMCDRVMFPNVGEVFAQKPMVGADGARWHPVEMPWRERCNGAVNVDHTVGIDGGSEPEQVNALQDPAHGRRAEPDFTSQLPNGGVSRFGVVPQAGGASEQDD